MEEVKFDLKGKGICFSLDKYSCHEKNNGVCSLAGLTIEEIRKYDLEFTYCPESNINYCRKLAKSIIVNGVCSNVRVFVNPDCSHYSLEDGNHRICIAGQLAKKGYKVEMMADLGMSIDICDACYQKNKNKRWIDRIKRLSREHTPYLKNF